MPTCILLPGHTSKSQGALAPDGTSEWEFNRLLAPLIHNFVRRTQILPFYRHHYADLPQELNQFPASFIIELHCNAFNREASGSEVLYCDKSPLSARYAAFLQREFVTALDLPNRGIKATRTEDRGGRLLCKTTAPCLIAEPFFIDNPDDFHRATSRRFSLANAYARAIDLISQEISHA